MSKCLDQVLLLPSYMQELKDMRKDEVFIPLKRDLAKVRLFLLDLTLDSLTLLIFY